MNAKDPKCIACLELKEGLEVYADFCAPADLCDAHWEEWYHGPEKEDWWETLFEKYENPNEDNR